MKYVLIISIFELIKITNNNFYNSKSKIEDEKEKLIVFLNISFDGTSPQMIVTIFL